VGACGQETPQPFQRLWDGVGPGDPDDVEAVPARDLRQVGLKLL